MRYLSTLIPPSFFQDFSGVRLWVGVTCTGLTVYCGQEPLLTKLNHFPWYGVHVHMIFIDISLVLFIQVLSIASFIQLFHIHRVRISGVNFKNKQLLLEMTPLPVRAVQYIIYIYTLNVHALCYAC